MTESDPLLTTLSRVARERLEADGWTVETRAIRSNPDAVQVELEHELMSCTLAGLRRSSAHVVADLEERLDQAEFQVVRARPPVIRNGAFLREVRMLAFRHDWSTDSLRQLAGLLEFHPLTTDEADWLAWAGPAWSQNPPDDPPPDWD
jgi:hypothetical protein